MQLHEKVNLIFGTFMVVIFLTVGVLFIVFNKFFQNPNLANLLGWATVGYGVIRFVRVYGIYKNWRRETQKR
ncbi:MAG: hypothetical protein MUC49_03095 [Raineya sp.]|jgi:hypothetical protein|nr:hypothetical protein [Raineya sp.]